MRDPVCFITLEAVKVAARAALLDGTLQAIRTKAGDGAECLYAGPCVIGAAVPADLRVTLDSLVDPQDDEDGHASDSDIGTLVAEGFVSCPIDEVHALKRLQCIHDKLVSERATRNPAADDTEKKLRALLDLPAPTPA